MVVFVTLIPIQVHYDSDSEPLVIYISHYIYE